MYNILERLEDFKLTYEDDPDIDYLRECRIGEVVNRGLADLYESQPINPINFLANWLLVESNGREIKKIIESEIKLKEKVKTNYLIRRKKSEEIQKDKESAIKKELDQKLNLLEKIKNCDNFESSLNSICEDLKRITKSTGVYFCVFDKKRKPVKIDDDENAHLINMKVIRYIAYCNDHEFLHNKNLELNQGITYDLFKKQEKKKKSKDENVDEEEPQEKKPKELSEDETRRIAENEIFIKDNNNFILIDEVVRNPRIKYFHEPRLGCYLAIEIILNSSISPTSLNSALQNLITYNTQVKDYEKRRNDYLKEIENAEAPAKDVKKNEGDDKSKSGENLKNAENQNKDNDANSENASQNLNNSKISNNVILNYSKDNIYNPNLNISKDNGNTSKMGSNKDNINIGNNQMGFPEENIVLKDYTTTEKKYIFCFDTLGQDRVYTLEEKKYIFEVTKLLKKSWEEIERKLLLKDRDLRIDQMQKEELLKDPLLMEKLESDEEKYIRDCFTDPGFSEIEDTEINQKYSILFKNRFLIYSIKQDPVMLELFNLIHQYEVIIIFS